MRLTTTTMGGLVVMASLVVGLATLGGCASDGGDDGAIDSVETEGSGPDLGDSGDDSGATVGDETGDDTPDDTPDDQTGDDSGDETGDDSGDDSGDQTGDDSGDQTGDDSGDQTGDENGDTTGNENGDSSGDETGDENGDTTGDTNGDTGNETGDETGDACGHSAAECWALFDCCEGHFCTYAGTSYVPGECSHPQSDGAYCQEDAWCQSGHCVDSTCQPEACLGVEGECWSDAECCDGTFCTYAGAYVPGTCNAPLPNGSPCELDAWCAGGYCTDGLCASESCTALDDACWSNTDCCTGVCSWTVESPYVPGTCIQLQPDGQACQADAWCASGWCNDGLCETPTCLAVGAECYSSFECCQHDGASFCTNTFQDYSPGTCQPSQPDGAWCLEASWCLSGNCVDAKCVPAGCQPQEEPCWSGGECCSGMCTWSGDETEPGTCITPQPAGAACVTHDWCQSGHCVDGACTTVGDAPTFAELWELIFQPAGCSSGYCHGSGNSQLSMVDESMAYYNLVVQPAALPGCGLVLRVAPGDPEGSVLWHRVAPAGSGALDCFEKMPYGSDGLSPEDADLVKSWIAAGAPQ